MIDLADLRDRPEAYDQAAKNKAVKVDVLAFLKLDEERRELQQHVDAMRSEKNSVSKAVPQMQGDEKAKAIADMKELGEKLKASEEKYSAMEEEWKKMYLLIPNLPLPEVPVGHSEEDNVSIREVGEKKTFAFEPKDHMALGTALGIIDVEKAAVVSGSRFAYLKGDAVRLQMAIIQLTFDTLADEKLLATLIAKNGLSVSPKAFLPMLPPVIMRKEVMDRMDRLQPEEQRYLLPEDGQVLVGSAEHTMGPYHMEETIAQENLPIRYIGFSTAFRREAGTYGKDMGGILRVHQFDKLEMESFSTAETGAEEQKLIVAVQEHLVQLIEVPYRVLQKCTYDIGKPNANGLDIECWIPSQQTYRETHTSDYMTDYQARRLGTYYKGPDGKKLAHMNDATAFAVGRTIIAILENHQNADGSVTIPKALRPYMGGQETIVCRA